MASLAFEIIPTNINSNHERKYRERTLVSVIKCINALLNSGGGKLELTYKRNPPKQHVHDTVKIIEQKVIDQIGLTTMVDTIKSRVVCSQKIVMHVKEGGGELWTVNYNLCLPVMSQVVQMPPTEPLEKICKIIRHGKGIHSDEEVKLASYHKVFVQNQEVPELQEDVHVQFKFVESSDGALAKRMVKNRFPDYVSAFANHLGGHIYYGVDDDAFARGLMVKNKMPSIEREIEKELKKLKWPVANLERGKHWEIVFIPVTGSNHLPVPDTYVIVVGVARCPGGVFTKAPESYYVDKNGKVKQMDVGEWKKKIFDVIDNRSSALINREPVISGDASNNHSQFVTKAAGLQITVPNLCSSIHAATVLPPQALPPHVTKVPWSSHKNHKIYLCSTLYLVECRNNNDMEKFESFANTAACSYPGSDAVLVVESERIAVQYKHHDFDGARSSLMIYRDEITKEGVNDPQIFGVRSLYLDSRILRAEGRIQESYKIAQDGLLLLENVPISFLTTWFYIHAAAVAMMIGTEPTIEKSQEAIVYLNSAEKHFELLECFPSDSHENDLKQKICIYQAQTKLGFSQSGNSLPHVSEKAVQEATAKLNMVRNVKQKTHFRRIQFMIAESDLMYRRSQQSENTIHKQEYHEKALKLCKKAYNLAHEHSFMEQHSYANRRVQRLSRLSSPVRLHSPPVSRLSTGEDLEIVQFQREFIDD